MDSPTAPDAVSVVLPGLGTGVGLTRDEGARFSCRISLPESEVSLWHASDPKLYAIRPQHGEDAVEDRVSLRKVTE